eukprot:gene2656-3073_t
MNHLPEQQQSAANVSGTSSNTVKQNKLKNKSSDKKKQESSMENGNNEQETAQPEKNTRKRVFIIGDSMLNGISEYGLNKVTTLIINHKERQFWNAEKVKNLNRKLKDACDKRQIKMIDNWNLDAECLSAKNLHLNPRVYAEALHLATSKHYKDALAEEAALQKKETEPEFTAKEAQMSKISRDVKSVEANDDHCDMSFINALNKKFQTMQHSQQPTKKADDKTAEQEEETSEVKQLALFGHKFTLDNIDLYVQPHELTEDHSNQDIHWISVMSPQSNHVFEIEYQATIYQVNPQNLKKLLHMNNALCLPSVKDHQTLVESLQKM